MEASMGIASLFRRLIGAQPEPQQTVTMPSPDDLERLQDQRQVVNAILAEHYQPASLSGTRADLALLQKVLDDRVLTPDQTYELQSLGIALGDVMAAGLGLHWVTVEDQYGRDPALQYEDTSLIVYPLTMISKRVERGESTQVAWLVETTQEQLTKLGKRVAALP